MAERFTAKGALVYKIMTQTGALKTNGHYVYKSEEHGNAYINKERITAHPLETELLCRMMAEDFRHDQIQTVVGPARGAVVLASNTAAALIRITKSEVYGVRADKKADDSGFHFTAGAEDFVRGRRILLVEDNATKGISLRSVAQLCEDVGGIVVGAAALVNRGGITAADIGVDRFKALLDFRLDSWPAEDCDLCKLGIPVNTDLGKGAEFLRRKAG